MEAKASCSPPGGWLLCKSYTCLIQCVVATSAISLRKWWNMRHNKIYHCVTCHLKNNNILQYWLKAHLCFDVRYVHGNRRSLVSVLCVYFVHIWKHTDTDETEQYHGKSPGGSVVHHLLMSDTLDSALPSSGCTAKQRIYGSVHEWLFERDVFLIVRKVGINEPIAD